MTCTFFGHADAPESIRAALFETIVLLINEGVDTFYVGTHGNFDRIVSGELLRAKMQFPHVICLSVLAYLRNQNNSKLETLFPEEAATAPARFAICRRNQFMLKKADIVVAYIRRQTGGAVKFVLEATRRGLRVIYL